MQIKTRLIATVLCLCGCLYLGLGLKQGYEAAQATHTAAIEAAAAADF